MSFDAVGIISADIDKSISFYNALGFNFEKYGKGHYEGKTPSGVRLMLDSVELIKIINPNWTEPNGSRIVLCFKQDSSKEVDRVYDKLVKAGFESEKEPWDAFWGQRYSSVRDPDGNQVDIFSNL